MVDIGGASTELVSLKKSYSLNMGSVILTENFLNPKSAVSLDDKKSLNQYIQSQLNPMDNFLKEDYDDLIFVAGTPVTLSFIETQSSDSNKIHGLRLQKDQVQFWLDKLSSMNVEERKKVPHLPEHRADVIVSGLSLLREILKRTGKNEFIVSAGGVRYGLMLELFQQNSLKSI